MFHRLLGPLALTLCLPAPALQSADRVLPRGDREEHQYSADFFPGAAHSDAITPVGAVLGAPAGSRLASPEQIVELFRIWASESDRIQVRTYGRTYEGRNQIAAWITSPRNHARLDAIQQANRRMVDPRGVSDEELTRLCAETPPIAWLGYSIHGDETSGSDAALALTWHLLAATDAQVSDLLERVVIVLDPSLNPDGRARILSMVEQFGGKRVNLDYETMARGRWPEGRGNHYLFDMNRDWMAGIAPETRARWALLRDWVPQLFVDGHEMSGLDTFLMYPQAAPRHPALPKNLIDWQGRFADAQATEFDGQGWGYYTREWADAWYPGYSDAWGSLHGGVGMLYEQGRGEGAPIRRLGGEVVSYREAVHGQVLASWSNLRTLAANGEALRRDFVAHRLAQLAPPEGETRAWVVPAGDPSRRVEFLIDALRGQNIEVERLTAPRKARAAVSALGESRDELELPAGSFVVRLAQPQGALVRSYLDFDPRIDAATLADERARLERGEGSRLYDVTAWDLARQCDVAAWWCDLEAGDSEVLVQSPAAIGGLIAPDGMQVPWGFAVDGSDDQVLAFAARAMELGYVLHASDEPFLGAVGRGATRTFPRGSLLLRRHENPEALWGLAGSPLEGAAAQSGVQLFALESGRAPDLDHPDLGGGHFSLLHRPRVGLLCGEPLGQTDFGHTWHYLDQVLSMPVSLLGAGGLGGVDLRRYNVLVVPSGDTGEILQGNWQRLAAWVRGGGTLIAIGDSAAALAELDPALGDVRTRGAAIEELDKYQAAARRARAAGRTPIDEALVWGDAQPATEAAETAQGAASDGGEDAEPAPGSLAALDEDLAAADRLARRFMPAGAILRSECDAHSWLTFGLGEQLAVPYAGSTVLLSTGEVPVRLAPAERVRLAGLVWPEARERLADGAWLAREGMGNGQVLLFAQDPAYRGSWLGTARLLGNAVVFGPGLGARAPGQW